MTRVRGWLSLALLTFLCTCVRAQTGPPDPGGGAAEVVEIDYADTLSLFARGRGQVLVGNVQLSQDSIFMYCDSARVVDQTDVRAFGNVTIQQGDSLAAFSDELDYDALTLLAKLRGNVALQRGETELYTDRLDYNLATKVATYRTGGRIVSRTTELSSTRGYYFADERRVYFRDSVVAIDDRFEMRADTLLYDLLAERVYFLGPTVIRTDTHRIYCEAGYYDVQLDEAVFADNAQYRSGERLAAADTIRYFGTDEAYVLEGRAYVAEGDFQRATAERIRYYRREDRYLLTGKATLRDSVKEVRGDTIAYDTRTGRSTVAGGRPRISAPPMIIEAERFVADDATGNSIASGRVAWRDTSTNVSIDAARAEYNEATGYLLATGGAGPYPGRPDLMMTRPLMTSLLQGDTMYMVADTLTSVEGVSHDTTYRSVVVGSDTTRLLGAAGDSLIIVPRLRTDTTVTTDSVRYLAAYRDVRILKSDLQAVCDSLGFDTRDSVLTLYQDPIVWQDSSQLTGDTVRIHLRNEALDKVELRRNALVLTTPDLVFFNQVKGRDIVARFDSTSLRRTDVTGNAEAIYYITDEAGAYAGVNKTACSAMVLYFRRGGVTKIRFLDAPSGRMDPMNAVDHETFKLAGFRWADELRPVLLRGLF